MTELAVPVGVPSPPWYWRLRTGSLHLGGTIPSGLLAALVGTLLLALGIWGVDDRAVDVLLRGLVARASDQAYLAILEQVPPDDLQPPFDQAKLARLDARLGPLLTVMRRPGSGIVRINLYARDGTLLFGDRAGLLGERVTPEGAPMLAQALQGTTQAERTSLDEVENEDLKQVMNEALEVYVPLVQDGRVVAAYEVYEDLTPIVWLRTVLWAMVITLGVVCGACLVLLRRALAGALKMRRVVALPPPAPRLTPSPVAVQAAPAAAPGAPSLSPREREVLCLLASSHSYREIAQRLVVSEETVRTHVKSILRKLGQPDRTQAVLAAVRLGLLHLR